MRAVLDTNILFSALLFGGKPKEIFTAVVEEKLIAVSSPILVEELFESLRKKSALTSFELRIIEEELRVALDLVYPRRAIAVVRDDDDNRVLEAAVAGNCQYIVTGDRDLLDMEKYRKIVIVTPAEFLKILS